MNTFSFVDFVPLTRKKDSVSRHMLWVLLALLPGIMVAAWLYGVGVLVNIGLCTVVALVTEAVLLYWRNRPVKRFLADGSAVVTAWILGLSMVPILPWQVSVAAAVFAMVIKHLYGGLGQNPFNPAMAAVCFIVIAFPADVNNWYTVLTVNEPAEQLALIFGLEDAHSAVVAGATPKTHQADQVVDAVSETHKADQLAGANPKHDKANQAAGATPKKYKVNQTELKSAKKSSDQPARDDIEVLKLADTVSVASQNTTVGNAIGYDTIASATPLTQLKATTTKAIQLAAMLKTDYLSQMLRYHGSLWLTLAYLAGGLLLLNRKIISWRAPVAFLAAIILTSGAFWLMNAEQYAPPYVHILVGGVMIGAFFIITDPVTGSGTPKGQLWFGFLAGVLVCLIRNWGAYPDGVAFSVLLMNLAAPMIDRLTIPAPFGKGV